MPDTMKPIEEVSLRLYLTPKETADALRVSLRTLWSRDAAGRVPRPYREGRKTLWSRQELIEWVYAGSPPRLKWEAIKSTLASRNNGFSRN